MKKELMKLFKKMEDAESRYQSAIGKLEAKLCAFSSFELFIEYQPSDGFVVIDQYANKAPLMDCIRSIDEQGKLYHSEYMKVTI